MRVDDKVTALVNVVGAGFVHGIDVVEIGGDDVVGQRLEPNDGGDDMRFGFLAGDGERDAGEHRLRFARECVQELTGLVQGIRLGHTAALKGDNGVGGNDAVVGEQGSAPGVFSLGILAGSLLRGIFQEDFVGLWDGDVKGEAEIVKDAAASRRGRGKK